MPRCGVTSVSRIARAARRVPNKSTSGVLHRIATKLLAGRTFLHVHNESVPGRRTREPGPISRTSPSPPWPATGASAVRPVPVPNRQVSSEGLPAERVRFLNFLSNLAEDTIGTLVTHLSGWAATGLNERRPHDSAR